MAYNYDVLGETKSNKTFISGTTISAITNGTLRSNPVVHPLKISYAERHITDADMEHIIKEALIEQECTELDLRSNRITHAGAEIVANALRDNRVRISLLIPKFCLISSMILLTFSQDSHCSMPLRQPNWRQRSTTFG